MNGLSPDDLVATVDAPSLDHACQAHPDWTEGEYCDRNDELMAACPACWADEQHTVARSAWEDQPRDPEEDLSLIDDYPEEVARLRRLHQYIAAEPVYKIVHRIGGDLRRDYLAECDSRGSTEPEEFFAARICECEGPCAVLYPELDEDDPDYDADEAELRAAPCFHCRALMALREAAWRELQAEVEAELANARATAERDAGRHLVAAVPAVPALAVIPVYPMNRGVA